MRILCSALIVALLSLPSVGFAQASVCENLFESRRPVSPYVSAPPAPVAQANSRRAGIAASLSMAPANLAQSPASLLALSVSSPGLGGYSNVVKVLVDVRDPKAPMAHYIDTKRTKYHYDYAVENFGYRGGLEQFNQRNYSGPHTQRDFIPVSILIKKTVTGQYDAILELFSGDTLTAESMKLMLDSVAAQTTGFQKIQFHPLSKEQEIAAERGLPKDRVQLTRNLSAQLTFLAHNPGTAVGYVKVVKKADYESGKVILGPTDIAVFDQVPNDIGFVAGIVSAEIQTALSHVNVKSINRKTVNAFMKNLAPLVALDGKPVELIARSGSFSLKEIPKAEADRRIAAFWSSRRKTTAQKPRFVLDPAFDAKVVDISNYYRRLPTIAGHRALILRVGAKAANIALLRVIVRGLNLKNVYVPEVASLPFNTFEAMWKTKQTGLDESNPARIMTIEERVHEILTGADLLNPEKIHRIEVVVPTLQKVRDTIAKGRVPDAVIADFKNHILSDANSPIYIGKHPRIRLRSS
ncbi:MAG: hypothetical protein AAB250_01505, partial [Bdellovibrionota bacterium]